MTSTSSPKYTTPVIKKYQPDDTYKFQPLPKATGTYPYHLDISKIMPDIGSGKLVFHMMGDTGSVRDRSFLKNVVEEMVAQMDQETDQANRPQFLYHLGDIVYNFGEACEYDQQFFEPFKHYPAPVFAIAGNHDADVNPDSTDHYQSLDPFNAVFCDNQPNRVLFSNNAGRKSNIQPNVFWTMDTPLATIIGLYSNVPKFGVITAEQRAWFITELINANAQRPGKAIIVCLHHAPYSADINHGSSLPMIDFLNGAFEAAAVLPDLVVSGHVHNYQRFNKMYAGDKQVTFLVAGAGGYDELHAVAVTSDEMFTGDSELFNSVTLENYCDDKHGFLKISLEKSEAGIKISGEFYAMQAASDANIGLKAMLADEFTIHL